MDERKGSTDSLPSSCSANFSGRVLVQPEMAENEESDNVEDDVESEDENLKAWRSHSMAVVLNGPEWSAITSGSSGAIVRGFRPSCSPLLAIVRSAQGPMAVGLFTCAEFADAGQDDRGLRAAIEEHCGNLFEDVYAVHAEKASAKLRWMWKVKSVYAFDQPSEVPGVNQKWYSRPFVVSGLGESLPWLPANLIETATYLLGRLPQEQQDTIRRIGRSLQGKEIRVGTTCSGTDICIAALRSVLDVISGQAVAHCVSTCAHGYEQIYIYIITANT